MNLGKIEDFFSESLRLQYQWALRLPVRRQHRNKNRRNASRSSSNTSGRTGAVYETLGGETDIGCGLAFQPVTSAAVTPASVNGWYQNPLVTLSATDQDADFDRSEYRIDGAPGWTIDAGPFAVTGDGQHTIQDRLIDKVGHVEDVHSLRVKVDATGPLITGMPRLRARSGRRTTSW